MRWNPPSGLPVPLAHLLKELEALKTSYDYSLRIAGTISGTMLEKSSAFHRNIRFFRTGIEKLLQILMPFISLDPNIHRIAMDLAEWRDKLLDIEPPPMYQNNPIFRSSGGDVSADEIRKFAIDKGWPAEFANEMVDAARYVTYTAREERDVPLYLTHVLNRVRMKGTVFLGLGEMVERAAYILASHTLPSTVRPVGIGYVLWIPENFRDEARQILSNRGFNVVRG